MMSHGHRAIQFPSVNVYIMSWGTVAVVLVLKYFGTFHLQKKLGSRFNSCFPHLHLRHWGPSSTKQAHWNTILGEIKETIHISIEFPWYCWWKKSCTSWYGESTTVAFTRLLYIPGGAGSRQIAAVFCLRWPWHPWHGRPGTPVFDNTKTSEHGTDRTLFWNWGPQRFFVHIVSLC